VAISGVTQAKLTLTINETCDYSHMLQAWGYATERVNVEPPIKMLRGKGTFVTSGVISTDIGRYLRYLPLLCLY